MLDPCMLHEYTEAVEGGRRALGLVFSNFSTAIASAKAVFQAVPIASSAYTNWRETVYVSGYIFEHVHRKIGKKEKKKVK